MVDISKIRVDAEAERTGRWVSWDHGIQLRIARMNTPAFQERMRELSQPNIEKIRDGDKDLIRAVTIECVAECVLLDWKGLEDGGEPLEYSKEKAVELLSDPGLRDLYEFVLTTAHGREKFLVEEPAKN